MFKIQKTDDRSKSQKLYTINTNTYTQGLNLSALKSDFQMKFSAPCEWIDISFLSYSVRVLNATGQPR